MIAEDDIRICIFGLGYVGLPLAVEFGKKYPTIGYDINRTRIDALRAGHDATLEVEDDELAGSQYLAYSDDGAGLEDCNIYIVTVPTPIDHSKEPNLGPLIEASKKIGQIMSEGDIVIFESTVYPGVTEDVCGPILAEQSGLVLNEGFYLGYSPERINPGDKDRGVTDILKITSGSTPEVADFINRLYLKIIRAGTHLAPSIKVAEGAKLIENVQRDMNIAVINELAIIFSHIGIDTQDVLDAAGTKWNFLPFRPGLVGGHCIGVDPYYLIHKSRALGHHPDVILSGRRINDLMGRHVVGEVIALMNDRGILLNGSRVLVMGLTFKENCPDIRNTKVVDVVETFKAHGADVDVIDPWCEPDQVRREYGLELVAEPKPGTYDAIVLAVAHEEFKAMSVADIRAFGKENNVLYDIKSMLPKAAVDGRL